MPEVDEDLQAAFDLFAEQFPQLREPEFADGECTVAVGWFYDLLERVLPEALPTDGGPWDVVLAEEVVGAAADFAYAAVGHSFYENGCNWAAHCVGRIRGNLLVDWTARQFTADAPFPLVFPCPPGRWWEEPDVVHPGVAALEAKT
jgi:hypothetical protein